MISLTPVQKFVAAIALSILGIGLSGGIFWWLSSAVRGGTETLQEIESKIAALESERKNARFFEAFLEERSDQFERIRRFSPNREQPVEFIEGLEALARDTKNLISLDFDEGRSKKNAELIFRLTVEGDETSPRKFLKLLLLLPYEIRVEDLVFQQIAAGGIAPEEQKSLAGRPTHRLFALISVKTF